MFGVLAVVGFIAWSRANVPQPPADRLVFEGGTMGTTYRVVVRGVDPSRREKLGATIESELEAVNASMSTYKDDSELSQLNRSPVGEAFSVSPELEEVVALAEQVSEASDGAFDVTVGALVDAWGFGPTRDESAPSDDEIARLRAQIGWRRVQRSPGTMTRTTELLRVDLSAIAKGYGVDRVAAALRAAGVEHFMVEVGGEIRTAGERQANEAWRIGIEEPHADPAKRSLHRVVQLDDAAMATSGDYRNYREVDGRRVSHTLDPRNGRPIEHRLASVSVIADQAALADAWATALNVLGPDAGLALAQRQGLAVYMIIRENNGFETRATPDFERHILPP